MLKNVQLEAGGAIISARGTREIEEKACTQGAEQMYKDNSQLRIEDFVFPYGKLDPENDWVKLAALVPWDVVEERYAAQFANNGYPAHPARMALRGAADPAAAEV